MNHLKRIITSNRFLPAVFIFFALQAVFYAGYIGFGIPSDENYHYGSIQYYADQPLATGPFTHDQDPSTIPIVRAIDRSPNYLFHYVMSFPLRLMEALHLDMHMQVIFLRLIDVVFGVLALYVLKKCLDEISSDKLIKNFTIFAVSVTGMAVWLPGAINYDNLANLLFLLFVWVCTRFIKKPTAAKTLLLLTLAPATVITKSTFSPILLVGLTAMVYFAWKKRFTPKVFWGQLTAALKARKIVIILLVLSTLLFGGLFFERDVVNLARYHSVRPSCTEFFSVDECRTYNVFNRNYKQKRIYTPEAKSYLVSQFDPISFTGEWIYGMYNTLFFQLGDRRFESAAANRVFAFIMLVVIAVTAFFARAKLRLSKAGWFVMGTAAFYVLMLYAYNLNTFFGIGQKYAYQGRYLLPVIGFVYFFFILMVVNTYRNRSPKRRQAFGFAWLAVTAMFILMHFPPMLLARYTAHGNPSWRETFVLPKEVID